MQIFLSQNANKRPNWKNVTHLFELENIGDRDISLLTEQNTGKLFPLSATDT